MGRRTFVDNLIGYCAAGVFVVVVVVAVLFRSINRLEIDLNLSSQSQPRGHDDGSCRKVARIIIKQTSELRYFGCTEQLPGVSFLSLGKILIHQKIMNSKCSLWERRGIVEKYTWSEG